jgi:RNA polymerase sigma factor (sigma-70 family)
MNSEHSVTHWIQRLRTGEDRAAAELWERYFQRVRELARKRLCDHPRQASDEEDVVVSVFDSLCRGVHEGRFDALSDRDDLWRLLIVLTRQKSVDAIRREARVKRGGGRVRSLDAIGDSEQDLIDFLTVDPDPAFLSSVNDECDRLLALLRDDTLRTIAVRKMEGFTNQDVAAELGVSERTIRRKVDLIREDWQNELIADV